ncbi:MAG TPA: NUDIX domain-containing protein [Ktedonosporobacter sp.]|jgi:8-oxo-dGTP pyrophosphatase MutT (NUDIX family)|nr:NUDIX domain-containing protein [Ktedonosporobacter sp.]
MRSEPPDPLEFQTWQRAAEIEGRECVVGAVIIDPQGRAFVQKRSLDRQLFPGCWDIVGGHVEPGETLYQCLCREADEETGWQIANIIAVLEQFDWAAGGQAKREFDLLVEVTGNLDEPRLEWSKHSEFRWISLDEIEILRENRTPDDTFIYDIVKKGLEYWQNR